MSEEERRILQLVIQGSDARCAAMEAIEAAREGKFLSIDDFRQRTKVSKTVIDLMEEMHLFGDIPQSNQISLFDNLLSV